MNNLHLLGASLLALCWTIHVNGDTLCERRGGKCQMTFFSCRGGSYIRGLCAGPTNRRCCSAGIPPIFNINRTQQPAGIPNTGQRIVGNGDTRCERRGGKCQMTFFSCPGGSYMRGLCAGPMNRQCCSVSEGCPGVTFVSRSAWGARSPKSVSTMRTPVSLVFIHHTAGSPCSSRRTCSQQARNVQNYHMNTRKYNDVGYNFLVGGDGASYEGRGWNKVGGHTRGYNSRSIAISFMGNFQRQLPTAAALQAAKNLIACGVKQGHISSSYSLYGHKQARGANTSCPGTALFNNLQSWPGFKNGQP